MAINVKSGGGTGASLVASFAGGRGKERNKAQLAGAQVSARSYNLERDRIFRKNRDELARENYLDDKKVVSEDKYDPRAFPFRKNKVVESEPDSNKVVDNSELIKNDSAPSDEQIKNNLDIERDQTQSDIGRIEDVDFSTFTDEMRTEWDRLSGIYGKAVKSGDYNGGELQTLKKQLREHQLGVMNNLPKAPKEEPEFSEKTLDKKIVWKNGVPYVENDKGVIEVVKGFKPPEKDDTEAKKAEADSKATVQFGKDFDSSQKRLTTKDNNNNDVLPTTEATLADMRKYAAARKQYMGGTEAEAVAAPGAEWKKGDTAELETEAPVKKETSTASRWERKE